MRRGVPGPHGHRRLRRFRTSDRCRDHTHPWYVRGGVAECVRLFVYLGKSPLPRVGRAVICHRKPAVCCVGKLNIKGYCG